MSPSTKLGPLPAWAWGLVILGGIGLGLYLRRGSKSSPQASLVSAGGPVASLGAAGGGSDGSDVGISTGMDPLLAQILSDQSSALVSESGIFAGLAAQSVQGALDASQSVLGTWSELVQKVTTQPIVYTVGSSPAGSSPVGTTTPPPPAAVTTLTDRPTPSLSTATVGITGVAMPGAGARSLVDETGHVVNAKGARVGGRTLES